MKDIVLSLGLGLDSTAILCLLWEKDIRPTKIIFADTGGERPDIYAHLQKVNRWLRSVGWDEVIVVSGKKTLEQDCLDRNTLPSLAFGYKTCSQRYKIRPIANHLRQDKAFMERMKANGGFTKIIGYDVSELDRAFSAEKTVDEGRNTEEYGLEFDLWFPLIDWGLTRDDLTAIVTKYGFCPAKSSCFFCPSMRPEEVIKLGKTYPELLERALAMEANAKLKESKGLGRSWNWGRVIDGDERQLKLFEEETPSLQCGCINW